VWILVLAYAFSITNSFDVMMSGILIATSVAVPKKVLYVPKLPVQISAGVRMTVFTMLARRGKRIAICALVPQMG
jgi:hypothetical protein